MNTYSLIAPPLLNIAAMFLLPILCAVAFVLISKKGKPYNELQSLWQFLSCFIGLASLCAAIATTWMLTSNARTVTKLLENPRCQISADAISDPQTGEPRITKLNFYIPPHSTTVDFQGTPISTFVYATSTSIGARASKNLLEAKNPRVTLALANLR